MYEKAALWPSPFAGTNYTPTCTAGAVSSGIPTVQRISRVAANKVTGVIQQAFASNAAFQSTFCTGIHNEVDTMKTKLILLSVLILGNVVPLYFQDLGASRGASLVSLNQLVG